MAAPTASVSMNSQKITNLATPTLDTDAANKGYVDSVAQGIDVKGSCRVATTAALPTVTYANGSSGVGATLTASAVGVLTVDGVATVLGDRILVKNQAAQLQNGIYVVTTEGTAGVAFVLTRSTDMDIAAEFPAAFTFIEAGTANSDSGWVCTTNAPVTVGTTNITFDQFSGAGQITAGNGLTKTGNTLDVNVDSRASGTATTEIVSDEVRIHSAWTGQNTLTTLGTVRTLRPLDSLMVARVRATPTSRLVMCLWAQRVQTGTRPSESLLLRTSTQQQTAVLMRARINPFWVNSLETI
jgi:hypothetical protein